MFNANPDPKTRRLNEAQQMQALMTHASPALNDLWNNDRNAIYEGKRR